jgi:hypothetical protein
VSAVADGVVTAGTVVTVAAAAGGGAWVSMLAVDLAFGAGRSVLAVLRGQPRALPVGHVGVHRLEGVTRRIVARPR